MRALSLLLGLSSYHEVRLQLALAPLAHAALELAADRIAAYHEAQMPADVRVEQPGVSIRGMHRAVERAACYVPGGRAVYPSTVLMTAVPARVAGVEQIVVCVPVHLSVELREFSTLLSFFVVLRNPKSASVIDPSINRL